MTDKKDFEEILAQLGLERIRSLDTEFDNLTLDPSWEDDKRRLQSLVERVMADLNPVFKRGRSCTAVFGTGAERNNAEAIRKWLGRNYHDQLKEEDCDVKELARKASLKTQEIIFEEGGVWQVME